jgi:hypothetical protein
VPVEYVVFVAFIVIVFADLVRDTLLPAVIFIVLAADPSYVYKLVFSVVPVSNFNVNLLLTLVAVDAVDAFPVKAPIKLVAVSAPVLGLYVNPVSVRGDKLPVAADTNKGYLVALEELSAVSVTADA